MITSNVSVSESKFVGREKELKNIKRLTQDASDGNGQFIVVKGEAGIGKTRFVKEAGKIAQEEGFEFHAGRCLSLEQTDPYQPFMEALSTKLGRNLEDEDVPLGLMGMGDSGYTSSNDGVPLGLLPITQSSDADMTRIDIQSERDKLFEKVLDAMERTSMRKPLFLFIDDLQWADTGTLQMLVYIARNISNSRILLCTAYRSEEVDAAGKPLAFYDHFNQALRNISLNQISLDRMPATEIAEMIKHILNIKDLPAQFTAKLYDESSGNPFFVEEVLRSLMDEGIILRHGHIWDAGVDLSKIRIPNTIKDVISHRIARLSEDDKKVLRFATVVGDTFSFAILKEVSGIQEEMLLDSLDRLMLADIVQEVPNTSDEEYGFDHKLIRSVIYDSMSQSRVRLLHKSVGEVIERLHPEQLKEWAFELARHFMLGKHTQKTYDYAILAGDKAFNALAFDRAVDYYITALRTMDLLPMTEGFDRDAEKIRLSMLVGSLYFGLGLWNNSIKYFEDALKTARKNSNETVEVKALISLGHSKRSAGNNREAEDHFVKADEIAGKLDDVQAMGEIQRGLGYVHWRKGENDEAIEHYNQSINFSMKAGNLSSMAKTFIELGNVYNNWGQYAKAIEYYSKSIVELEKLGEYYELARAYNNIGDTYLHMNEWNKAIEALEKCREVSEKIGNRNMVAWAQFNTAEALAKIGELDKAEAYCINAQNICESQDDKIGMNGVFRCLGIIYRLKKDWDQAVENINKSIVILEILDIPFDLAATYFELGLTYEEMGEKMAAIDNYNIAKNYYESVGAKNQAESTAERVKTLQA
ncbi:MAG: tetratricopeptide repeat protein [Thermoplasmata archaeon]|nr:tetratricopeptide repeat protein [Thermoplasmata archaeon]